jgi:hypothetical protein
MKISKELPFLLSLIIGLFFIILWEKYGKGDFGILIQIIISFAILWYSLETRIVKKAMVFQNDFQQRPIVDLYLRNSGSPSIAYFALRNIGKGAAYNIEINDIKINNFVYRFFIDEANIILAPNKDEKKLGFIYWSEGYLLSRDTLYFLNEFLSDNFIKEKQEEKFCVFLVKYNDLLGNKYYSLFKFYSRVPSGKEFTIEFLENSIGEITNTVALSKSKKSKFFESTYRNPNI